MEVTSLQLLANQTEAVPTPGQLRHRVWSLLYPKKVFNPALETTSHQLGLQRPHFQADIPTYGHSTVTT